MTMARFLLALAFLLPSLAAAETASVTVDHLMLEEAAELVRTQLSPQGSVAMLAPRRILVIQDDAKHVQQARDILRRLDVPLPAFVLHLDVLESRSDSRSGAGVREIRLPGGWVQVQAEHVYSDSGRARSFELRLLDGREARIELGEIRPIRSEVRRWLGAHGVADSVMLSPVPITAGVVVSATGIGDNRVRVSLHPWLSQEQASVQAQGRAEVLVDLGSIDNPATPPANNAPVRLNANPYARSEAPIIEVMSAATEVVVDLGKPLSVAAMGQDAKGFSQALLSHSTDAAHRHVQFVLTIRPAP